MTGAKDCHGGPFEMGSNAALVRIEEGDNKETIVSRRGEMAALCASQGVVSGHWNRRDLTEDNNHGGGRAAIDCGYIAR